MNAKPRPKTPCSQVCMIVWLQLCKRVPGVAHFPDCHHDNNMTITTHMEGGAEKSSCRHNTRTKPVRSGGKQEASSAHAFFLKGHLYLQALVFFHLRLMRAEFDHFCFLVWFCCNFKDGRDACTCSCSLLGRCSVFVQPQMTLVCI